MSELIDQFCESKHRWLIVTGVTVLLILLTVVPLVDQYNTLRSDKAGLTNQLLEVERLIADLPVFQQRVEQKLGELSATEDAAVGEDTVGAYRNRLIEFARESGCKVRRISFGAARKRPWLEEDNVMEPAGAKGKKDGKPTPFVVETRPVTLSVDGSTAAVKKLLGRVQSDNTMQHIRFFELRPVGNSRQLVQMDLELWCYALEHAGA